MSLLPRLIRALQAFGPAAGTSCPGEPGRPDRAAPLRHADFAMAGMGRDERVVARRCCSASTRISPRNAGSAASSRGGVYGSIQPSSSRGRFVAFGGDVYAAEHSVLPSEAVMIAASVDPDTVRVGAVDLLP